MSSRYGNGVARPTLIDQVTVGFWEGTGVRPFWKNGAIAFLGFAAGWVLAAGFFWASDFDPLGSGATADPLGAAKLLGALALLGLSPAAALAIADLLQGQFSPRRCLVGTLVSAVAAPILVYFTFDLGWGGLPFFASSFAAVVAEAWRRL